MCSMYCCSQFNQQLSTLPNSPHSLLSPLQPHPVSYRIVSTSLNIVDGRIVLYEEYNFFLILQGGRESEVEGPAISLGTVGQLMIAL